MTLPESQQYDAVIIGGGPAGLNAALVLGRACRRVVVIDAGHPRNAAAREFHGFLGRDGGSPRDLLADGRREIARYGVELVQDTVEKAECVSESDGPTAFVVETKTGKKFQGRKLLFATGLCDDIPEWPGARECYGASLHHCPYCDAWEHRGQRLLAYGNSPAAAVGLGLLLRDWSENITVLTDGQPASQEERDRLAPLGIALQEEPIVRLTHEEHRLTGVEFASGKTLPAEALFFNTGRRATCNLPRLLGCAFEEDETHARTTVKKRSNISGVFVAGDADGDVQFVIVAAAEGATAALAMHKELQAEDREEAGERMKDEG